MKGTTPSARLALAAGCAWAIGLAVGASALCAEAQQKQDEKARENPIRLAKEAWAISAREGRLKGIREVELLRADLLSVTLDPAITGAPDPRPASSRAEENVE